MLGLIKGHAEPLAQFLPTTNSFCSHALAQIHRRKHELHAGLYDSQKALIVLSKCPLQRPIIATSSPPSH